MSVEFHVTLKCDGPGCTRTVVRDYHGTMTRSDVEAQRRAARGWHRFRLANTGPNGDYCPDCTTRLTAEKARSRATKGGRP